MFPNKKILQWYLFRPDPTPKPGSLFRNQNILTDLFLFLLFLLQALSRIF